MSYPMIVEKFLSICPKRHFWLLLCLLLAPCGLLASCGQKGSFVSVDAERFALEIAKPGVQLVDVRTPEEFAESHIPLAINIDVKAEDFDEKISALSKQNTVAIYCRSGRRSKLAAEKMVAAGFRVVELDTGILSWTGELVKSCGAADADKDRYNRISPLF